MSKKIKIAALMLSLAVALPMSTLGASTNSLGKETLHVREDTPVDIACVNNLKIKFTDNIGDKEEFYLDLTNAVWDDATIAEYNANNTSYVTYEKQSDTTLKVTVGEEAFAGNQNPDDVTKVSLPLLAKVLKGEATVTVVAKGGSTTVSQGTFLFAYIEKEQVNDASMEQLDVLNINFANNAGKKEEFYLELDKATWDEETIEDYNHNKSGITYKVMSDTVVKVTVPKKVFKKSNTKVKLPIFADKEQGATVSIRAIEGNTTLKEAVYPLS